MTYANSKANHIPIDTFRKRKPECSSSSEHGTRHPTNKDSFLPYEKDHITEHLLHARHCGRYFTFIISFNFKILFNTQPYFLKVFLHPRTEQLSMIQLSTSYAVFFRKSY